MGATFSSYEENVAALAGIGRPSRTIPRALQSHSSLCSPFLHGTGVEGIKICPADIVSQLFPLDNSGWDSNLEPLRLRGIQCIPDDNPRDSRPCLCAASPERWKDWAAQVWARTWPPGTNTGPPFFGRDRSEVWKFSSNSKIL